jgi:hypothetical protein
MPLLDEAYRRVRQSKKRLVDLKNRIESFRETQTGVVIAQHKPSAPDQFTYPLTDPLDDLAVLISEIVQHLAIALNYLVAALAESRGRPVNENLQFPICDMPKQFRRRIPSELKGLSEKQITLIEKFQPYNDNRWLGLIRDLSNPDKHRHPIKISAGASHISIRALSHTETKTPLGKSLFVPDTVQMNYNFGLPIVFTKDHAPVIETLQVLHLKVSDLLDAFRPSFEE